MLRPYFAVSGGKSWTQLPRHPDWAAARQALHLGLSCHKFDTLLSRVVCFAPVEFGAGLTSTSADQPSCGHRTGLLSLVYYDVYGSSKTLQLLSTLRRLLRRHRLGLR